MIGLPGAEVEAADDRPSPFTLTCGGAITRNEPGKVNITITSDAAYQGAIRRKPSP
nr:hypothetical protein [Pseudomonas fluorescens]